LNNITVNLRGRFIRNDLFSLKVLSLHEGIINLLDQDTKYLISLIKSKKNMTGLSLLVPDLFHNADMIPMLEQNIVLHKMGINYHDAKEWSGCITAAKGKLKHRIGEIETLKNRIDSGRSFLALITNTISTEFQYKANSIIENHVLMFNETLQGLEGLIGLGQGLTPSGDDFITGALLAEKWLMESIKIDKSAISNALNKTSYAGRSLLYLALEGSFPAYLLSFINNLSIIRNENDFLRTVKDAAEHGSTSGLDSLAGFYWYCKYINDPKP